MKIAIIVKDANGMMHAGLDVTTTVRLFDMPKEIADYISTNSDRYVSVTLAIEDTKVKP